MEQVLSKTNTSIVDFKALDHTKEIITADRKTLNFVMNDGSLSSLILPAPISELELENLNDIITKNYGQVRYIANKLENTLDKIYALQEQELHANSATNITTPPIVNLDFENAKVPSLKSHPVQMPPSFLDVLKDLQTPDSIAHQIANKPKSFLGELFSFSRKPELEIKVEVTRTNELTPPISDNPSLGLGEFMENHQSIRSLADEAPKPGKLMSFLKKFIPVSKNENTLPEPVTSVAKPFPAVLTINPERVIVAKNPVEEAIVSTKVNVPVLEIRKLLESLAAIKLPGSSREDLPKIASALGISMSDLKNPQGQVVVDEKVAKLNSWRIASKASNSVSVQKKCNEIFGKEVISWKELEVKRLARRSNPATPQLNLATKPLEVVNPAKERIVITPPAAVVADSPKVAFSKVSFRERISLALTNATINLVTPFYKLSGFIQDEVRSFKNAFSQRATTASAAFLLVGGGLVGKSVVTETNSDPISPKIQSSLVEKSTLPSSEFNFSSESLPTASATNVIVGASQDPVASEPTLVQKVSFTNEEIRKFSFRAVRNYAKNYRQAEKFCIETFGLTFNDILNDRNGTQHVDARLASLMQEVLPNIGLRDPEVIQGRTSQILAEIKQK